MPSAQKRLGELDALMADKNFWNNREQAQKLIDEANALRNKAEPLLRAGDVKETSASGRVFPRRWSTAL